MQIAQSNFREEIPKLHPLTSLYAEYWQEQKRRCIEGYWVGGYWMPPKLYFYINFGTILLKENENDKVRKFGSPRLSDKEWMIFRDITEARGFSGFERDDLYSCNKLLLQELTIEELPESCISSNGKKKTYVPTQEYLWMQHPDNMGKALYENEAENYILMGARGFGKSYSVAGIIAHEFLFDGMTTYDRTIAPPSIDIVVGAGHSNFSGDLLKKVKVILDKLPGEQEVMGRVYPAPFSKKTMGSLSPSSTLTAKYNMRLGNQWKTMGSLSSIKHVSYADNPFAAQGGRNTLMIYEEVGMHSNILECLEASVENMIIEGRKYGTAILLGTGGDMEGGGTIGAKKIFYNPARYDALAFDDHYEKKGRIGRFIGAQYNLREYKDEFGFTDLDKAKERLLKNRQLLENKKGSEAALTKEIVNKPIVPSEMFLAENSNLLPAAEAARRLSELETGNLYRLTEKVVDLYFDPEANATYGVNYVIDVKGTKKPLTSYISKDNKKGEGREGAIVIYEFPSTIGGIVPHEGYVIGHDPYRNDTETGESLASIFVVKTAKFFDEIGHDEIVAEYVGRPYEGMDKVNEILYKLSLFYGEAKIYFENEVGNTKDYFEKIKRLDLLATKPTSLFTTTASYHRAPTVEYGYPMSNRFIKNKGISYLRDWLLAPRASDGKRNIDLIMSRALLEEIVFFNYEGNFDRVMGLMGAVFGLAQLSRSMEESLNLPGRREEYKHLNDIFNNKKIFNNAAHNSGISSTEDVYERKIGLW